MWCSGAGQNSLLRYYTIVATFLQICLHLFGIQTKGVWQMAVIKKRVQMYDSQRKAWVKYDTRTGAIMQIKHDGKPFSRIRKV